MLERKGIFPIEEVKRAILPYYKGDKNGEMVFHGDKMNPLSQRYEVFFKKGMKCCKCGLEGKYFAKERHITPKGEIISPKYHFNLYALDENGNEVLMTKDHIIPKSKGGKDCLDNYQTMCARCNEAKGNSME